MNVLQARDLYKGFDTPHARIEILKGLNLEVKAKESVSIEGPSGSGKSTLLALLGGLDLPDRGDVELDGTSFSKLDEEGRGRFRAARMGIVFQHFHLLGHLTAAENVGLPLEILNKKNARSRAEDLLARVGLTNRRRHFPHQLSGGEKQRVALARALVTEPALLLADEPTGSLDPKTAPEMVQLLFELVRERGAAMILVTHNPEIAVMCSARMRLDDGVLKC
jgi:putative ABC transport system ATP-binding protein